ncbi:hypothetical protein GGI35DRAFT_473301 [Trichoderma velutinum]
MKWLMFPYIHTTHKARSVRGMHIFTCRVNRLMARVHVTVEGRDEKEKKEKWTQPSGTSHQFPRSRTDIGEILEDAPGKVSSALVILGSVIQTIDTDVLNLKHRPTALPDGLK